ncbi:MAG: RNA-binding transcriptional accessory protein [Cyclobacteriaceae bacterium]|nr:RNA-binding transcriptional accessory protein [Cyclobacteriaceae bacterium]MDH4298476.1 RNA-binding transcriptional accessory protein [Cyclobacteriaceae bacterium]MDH5250479.1 RNA-binding transcriptional accessory protein [Cyclobacteriaceae bacterium]
MEQENISRWVEQIAKQFSLQTKNVKSVVSLLHEGATVPFLSRYRKEMTGSMDEVMITNIRDRIEQLQELDARREAIINSVEKQGNLSLELMQAIVSAETLAQLEDIYLPYKPKRKTRASVAREKGLEPLAKRIFDQEKFDIEEGAKSFIDTTKGVNDFDEVLAGARDIIAEWVSENLQVRKAIRDLFWQEGVMVSSVLKGKEKEGQKYKDYFDWTESISKTPSHRLLAMRRAEKEGILGLDISPPEAIALHAMERQLISKENAASEQVKLAIADSYKRLLKPSMETEIRMQSKMKADDDAIKVFADNLRELMLAAPLGQKNVLALDPGFRTGCKLVCLDRQGKLLHHDTIFPNEPQRDTAASAASVKSLCEQFNIEAISIGNGTAGRETESFVRSIGLSHKIIIVMVNESGASVYSASDVAREEFPDKDITVRGAVSIGRRLMDPLAELVKIDAKSIGVGQYQHDVDQFKLKSGLDDTVIRCVNSVGVEVNTASKELLSYVSGLSPALARNIVEFRNQHGPFKNRHALMNVPRLGEKIFEQAAGFLRIHEAENPLDASAVHPESYSIVQQMADDLGCAVKDLMTSGDLRKQLDLKKYVTEKVGLPTLSDIIVELEKPGRDPRKKFEVFSFTEGINTISDLKLGMRLPGIVTNVTKFGAFIDIGVHQDGLVHISHLKDEFVKDPQEVVTVQQKVMVTVTEVDIPRKRIGLSMKRDPFAQGETPAKPTPVHRKKNTKSKTPQKANEKELSMEEKLAMLVNKFKK